MAKRESVIKKAEVYVVELWEDGETEGRKVPRR